LAWRLLGVLLGLGAVARASGDGGFRTDAPNACSP